ncbi:MAG: outer membrane protein assembly factor BamD [Polyangiales bacterium]
MSSRAFAFAAVLALSGVALACGPAEKKYNTGVLQYSENARRAYEDAMVAFREKDWQEATRMFQEVRRRFSFSIYAPLAQLRLADIDFEQEKWTEAISAYKTFVRENPKHAETAYARMRIARGYYNQISDAFLLPAQEERDQSNVVEAAREIGMYLEEFPEGPEHAKMKELHADCLARLVAHELYVARFYMRKDKLEAALARATYAVTKYKGSKRDVEALVVQGEILLMLKRKAEAQKTFEYVIKKFPDHPQTEQARKFLAKIEKGG